MGSIEKSLHAKGYNIFVCNSLGQQELEKEKVQILFQRQIDGLLIYPCCEDLSYMEGLNINKVPVVTLDNAVINYDCDQVLTDNISAVYNATEWLINNNHRRIGIISGQLDAFTSRERIKGYTRAFEDYSVTIDDTLVLTEGYSIENGYNSIKKLLELKNPPSAVITCNYYTTLGAVKVINQLGICVPKELSIIGFDNIGLSEFLNPALTIIVQPMQEAGEKAAELIIRRILGDFQGFPQVLRLKTELVFRDSTGIYNKEE